MSINNFKDNVDKKYINIEPFWGRVEALNNVQVPTKEAIRNYQIAKIKQFQDIALSKKEQKEINAFFKEKNGNSIIVNYEKEEEIFEIETKKRGLNGISYTEWNPETDKMIYKNYNVKNAIKIINMEVNYVIIVIEPYELIVYDYNKKNLLNKSVGSPKKTQKNEFTRKKV